MNSTIIQFTREYFLTAVRLCETGLEVTKIQTLQGEEFLVKLIEGLDIMYIHTCIVGKSYGKKPVKITEVKNATREGNETRF